MPSSTMHTKRVGSVRAEARRVSPVGLDRGVEAYFSALDREALMDAEQERSAAERILRLRCEYWNRLLGHPPFLDAMLSLVQQTLTARGRKARSMSEMLRAARVLRGRPKQIERVHAEAVRAAFAEELAELDP